MTRFTLVWPSRFLRWLLGLLAAVVLSVSALAMTGGETPRTQAEPVVLIVAAASDLIPAFEDLGELFEQETGVQVDFTFGSTGLLTQQIEAGAPIDVFAAANVAYVERLEEQGLIIPETKALYGQGRIVLWSQPDNAVEVTGIQDLTNPDIARIAIANPDHAPYGVAAREALETAGIWEELQPRLVLGENIRDTLRYAETGNVDVAIVALSLALASDGSWTLVPDELHEPIDQALAVIASTDHEPEARAFAEFVNGESGREVMRRYGFVLPGEEPTATPPAVPGVATPAA